MRTVKKTWRREQMERRQPAAAEPAKSRSRPPMRRNEWTTRCYEILDAVRAGAITDEMRTDVIRTALADVTDSPTFSLLCFTGCQIANLANDYDAVIDLMHLYFRSPLGDADDRTTRLAHRLVLAGALLRAGRAGHESEAINLYRQLLATARRIDVSVVRTSCRNHLADYCGTKPPESVAAPGLSALTGDIISQYRKRKLAAQVREVEATHGLLLEALRSTLPPGSQD